MPKPKTRRVNGVTFTESTGNVWRDGGCPDAEERHLKSLLSIAIRDRIETLGLTQSEAARRLGLHRPRMTEIWNNRVDKYTIDNLANILMRLGARLQLTIRFDGPAGFQAVAPDPAP